MKEIFEISLAIIASLGGSAILLAAFSSWLGNVWAKRMLQNERAKNESVLEEVKKELDILKHKELTRHFDKLAIYKDVVHLISEILRELEAVALSKQKNINPDVEHSFSLCRNAGRDSLYHARKLWKIPVTENNYSSWKTTMSSISLCDTRRESNACPKGYQRVNDP